MLRRLVALTILGATALSGWAQNGEGTITGRVSNAGTGVYLQGATVGVEGTNIAVATERDGSYRLTVPAGNHRLIANYTGLDPQETSVSVSANGSATADFALTSEIYRLSEYVVASEREGNALAITLQRQAPNVKNVVSSDAFGSLAGNPADLLERVPGITVDRVGGDVRFIAIRGISGNLNSVQVDGNRIASTGADGRGFQFQNVGADHIESMEVVKAPTPDIDADSIGGSVNLKSRSAFDLTGRRITYSIGGIVGYDRDSPHPAVTFSYSDVFSVAGGERNLGISLSAGWRKHRASLDNVRQDYQRTNDSPAYRYRTEIRDFTNFRTRYGGGLKLDYKLSDDSMVFANFTFSPHKEPGASRSAIYQTALRVATIDPNTGQPTGIGTILPGYTDERTEARPLNTSFLRLTNLLHDRNATSASGQIGGRVEKADWELDYDVSFSYARNELWNYVSTTNLRGLGFVTDSTGQERWHPTVEVTSGHDIFDLDIYGDNQLTHLNRPIQNEIRGAQINYRKDFDVAVPAYIKTGLKIREETQERWNNNQRWNYVGPDGTMGTADDQLSQFTEDNAYEAVGGLYPDWNFLDTRAMIDSLQANPGLFSEDHAYRVQQNLTGRQSLEERVTAGYILGNAQISQFSILAGVRVEQTDVSGSGALRYLSPEEIARRAAWQGPLTDDEIIRRSTEEYGSRRTVDRDYRNVFPGVHLKFEPIDGLLFRASYSNGIGRPAFTAIAPNDTVFDDSMVVIASNPGLRPQYSENFDLSAEYYMEPVGLLSVGVFRKDIEDFIFNSSGALIPEGPDNGFNGEYAGYELRTQANGGFARVEGFELNYQQQFSFLPGWWNGFGFFANYTWLDTMGDYGNVGNVRTTGAIAGFKPRAANAGISYIRNKINFRIHFGHNGEFLSTFNAQDYLKLYRLAENRVDIKLKYLLNRNLDIYFDVYNVFNDKYRLEYGSNSRPRQSNDRHDPQFHFGVNGRF